MNKIKSICVFCGSSESADNSYKKVAMELGCAIGKKGIDLIYGGASIGLMGCVARGVPEEKGNVIGILPEFFRSKDIEYLDADELIVTKDMRERKAKMDERSDAFIVLPGGVGTLDELFEAITLIQTGKIGRFPIVLVGSSYWQGMVDWIKDTVLEIEQNISIEDLDLFNIVDTPAAAVEIIEEFYKKYTLQPNF